MRKGATPLLKGNAVAGVDQGERDGGEEEAAQCPDAPAAEAGPRPVAGHPGDRHADHHDEGVLDQQVRQYADLLVRLDVLDEVRRHELRRQRNDQPVAEPGEPVRQQPAPPDRTGLAGVAGHVRIPGRSEPPGHAAASGRPGGTGAERRGGRLEGVGEEISPIPAKVNKAHVGREEPPLDSGGEERRSSNM
ncbi:hypothetical protein [Actinomadura sp. 9N407]|uniref:hypothetical protein n=1 Tax=Actinomadura sp. 9N407 TaxID=3375154 RepID=UPI00378E30FF